MSVRLGLVAACAGLLAALAPSAAAGSGCVVLVDPADDVRTDAGVAVPDGHLDLRSVSLTRSADRLVVAIRQTDLADSRKGEWRLTFVSGRSRLHVFAGLGMWVNVGTYTGPAGFTAGAAGRQPVRVTGTFDAATDEIRVTVPLRALGIGRHARLSGFRLEAKEVFANLSPTVPGSRATALVDDVASARVVSVSSC